MRLSTPNNNGNSDAKAKNKSNDGNTLKMIPSLTCRFQEYRFVPRLLYLTFQFFHLSNVDVSVVTQVASPPPSPKMSLGGDRNSVRIR